MGAGEGAAPCHQSKVVVWCSTAGSWAEVILEIAPRPVQWLMEKIFGQLEWNENWKKSALSIMAGA